MTKTPRKNVPDVGIELGAACMPSEHASDRATAPGISLEDSTVRSKWTNPFSGVCDFFCFFFSFISFE